MYRITLNFSDKIIQLGRLPVARKALRLMPVTLYATVYVVKTGLVASNPTSITWAMGDKSYCLFGKISVYIGSLYP